VLFAEHSDAKGGGGAAEKSSAQIQAFKDTWTWDHQASLDFTDAVKNGGTHVANAMMAFRTLLGTSDMLAYLAMMAPRLLELRRVLKETGSIFLHCDPTASHYLKLLMDAVFGPENFCNEIIWRRTGAHNSSKRFAPIHDTILFARKSASARWNMPRRPYMNKHVSDHFVQDSKGWKTAYYGNVLTGSGTRNGESGMTWRGFDPTKKGRHWAIPGKLVQELKETTGEDISGLSTLEKLERLYALGYITITKGAAWPEYSLYIDPAQGQPASDVWAFQPYTQNLVWGSDFGIDEDVRWLSPRDAERLGYPTQKPLGLMARIIECCTEPGDIVLDPFCGCGTTIAAAQKLNRRWIGIDITHLAINLIKVRLADTFSRKILGNYTVVGEPEDLQGAQALAEQDKYQFQYWALGLVGARPAASQEKKGADKGIDGRLYITDQDGQMRPVIISVKGGHVTVNQIRDLRGVIERENAAIGVFISLEPPTGPMRKEAADAGFYNNQSHVGESQHPRLQLLTIEELLQGKRIDLPVQQEVRSFKQAPKAKATNVSNPLLDFDSKSTN